MAYDVARYLSCDCLYFDLRCGTGILEYWEDYELSAYKRVLLVDDVVVTGGTLRALAAHCEKAHLRVVGITTLIAYPRSALPAGVSCLCLAPTLAVTYEESACPLCTAGITLTLLR